MLIQLDIYSILILFIYTLSVAAALTVFKRPPQQLSYFCHSESSRPYVPLSLEERLNSLKFGYEESTRSVGNSSTGIKITSIAVVVDNRDIDQSYKRLRCSKGHEWKAVPESEVCFECPTCAQTRRCLPTRRKLIPLENSAENTNPSVGWLDSPVSLQDPHAFAREGKFAGAFGEGPNSPRQRLESRSALASLHAKIRRIAAANGGYVVSDLKNTVLGWKNCVILECSMGHRWEAQASNVVARGSWCPKCSRRKAGLNRKDMEATAAYFGGEYLGIEQPNHRGTGALSSARARWKCREGHIFTRSANNIRRRSPSPQTLRDLVEAAGLDGRPLARRSSLRKCAWCPDCQAQGKVFVWKPE